MQYFRIVQKKTFNVCPRCYNRSYILDTQTNEHDLLEITHIIFNGSPDVYFDKVFFDATKWCMFCKITPLFDVFNPDECITKYGQYIHNFENILVQNEEVITAVWLEKVDDSLIF